MGMFDKVLDDTYRAESGHAAILNFPRIESEPAPSVIWQDEYSALRYDQKYAVTEEHQLVILSASHDDEKAYRYGCFYLCLYFITRFTAPNHHYIV
jgi:protein sidekick